MRRASFRRAWSPAGIDVKRQWISAYRRLTWTLLHTPFLPCPLPLPLTRALARYKRRERGVPQQRRVSAPWRAPASSCCPSWVLPCCCCYLCWAPVPRRMLSSSPEPWTSSPPWRMPPMRKSWSVSPMPQTPLACRAVPPLYLLSSLLPTPFPESGRGEMRMRSPGSLSSSQQSCPRSSEQHEPPLQGSGTCCQYLGQRSPSFHPSSNPFCLLCHRVEGVWFWGSLKIGLEVSTWAGLAAKAATSGSGGRYVADRSAAGSPEEAQE